MWVKGHPKQIGGVSHKTTAVEIVSFVLSECVWSTTEKARRSGRCYALFENWRGCQRLIPPGKRIYKLWKLWGLERIHVKFVVKKVAMETLARKDFGEYVEASQLKVPKRHVALRMEPHAVGGDDSENTSSSDGVGLYLLNESVADGGQSPATRRKRTLLKQVLRQSEQLQGISRTVEDMDEEILFYEAKLHHYRLLEGGKDYVQDAYLAERDENGLENQDNSNSCGTIQEEVTASSKEGREQNVQNDQQTDDRTLNSIGRENAAEQHINIEENSWKKHGHSEVVLGKKNGTKVLVVNPLPRDHTTSSQTPDQTEHEILKTEHVSHHHHTDARKESPVYEDTTPSFRSTKKRQHKHGGRVKKRLPGLYEFEQSCEWLKVMDKELKRLESMENLSFVDWDSESLLSDKDLKCRGNRKFKFRNAFANRNREAKTSGTVNTNSSMKVGELNVSISDLQLEHKLCLTSADCANENKMPEAKVIETWVDGNMETKDGPQPISERSDLTSTQVTRSEGSLFADSNTSHAAGISEVMKGTLVCSPECKLKEKGMRCQLVSKEKTSYHSEREEGKEEKFDNSKPADSSKPETIEKKCPKDDAKILPYMPTSRQSLPQPILAPMKKTSNANTAPRARLQMSSPEASNLKQNDRSGSNFPLQSTKGNTSKVHSMNVLTNGERSEESHRTKSNAKPVSRNPSVVLSEQVVKNKQCDENNEIRAVHSITAAKCGNKFSSRPVPEPQSSPVSVRRVPKPPIYYPTEDSGPVRHSPTEPNHVLSRSSLNNSHCIQRPGVACSTGMAPKSYCSSALHPRVEQLRSCKLNGHVLSSTIKVSLEKETGECNNLRQDLKSAISKKKVESDVLNGQGISKIGRKVYFKDEQELPIREPVHSTPIKSKILKPSTSRVRSPDQGLGQDILSPVEKGKSAENVDSGSDTGLSSVHSQDSGISNASVVIETWV